MVLMKDESRWSVISFFDSDEAAAEERFEQMGDEVPESVRGKRVSLASFEVVFDVEMVRERQRTTVSPVASAEALM
ncbi:MAG: hypothetical protein ACXVHQ_31425 [Solirubrobacteraceae bacterium]